MVSGHYRQTWSVAQTRTKGTTWAEKSCLNVSRLGSSYCLTQPHLCCQGSTELIANAKPQLGVGRTERVKCLAGECLYQSPSAREGVPSPTPSHSPLFSIQAESEKVFSCAPRCQPDLGSSAGIAERSRKDTKASFHKAPFHLGSMSIKYVLLMCIHFYKEIIKWRLSH